jgi:ankyrin repeat protein|tara:strand:+ start:1658 stop:2116 length:459 start_codon:yes stop_codon:yes gene_type:complete
MSTSVGPALGDDLRGFLTRAERADAFIDAAGLGHIVEVQRLIASGDVDVNAVDEEDSNTALLLAAQNGRPMVVAALLEAGANVDAANNNGDTPLILACLNGHGHIVDVLLKAGADVTAVDTYGSCALFYASRQGHCGLVDALLAAGADVNHR